MKKNILQRALLFSGAVVLLWQPYSSYAQSVKRQCISSYGASTLSNGILVSQTAGQGYNTSSSASVSQGFQQPKVFRIERVNMQTHTTLDVSVFPNPASYIIQFSGSNLNEVLQVSVSDITGKTLVDEQVADILSYQINCQSWNEGTYFITVAGKDKKRSVFQLLITK